MILAIRASGICLQPTGDILAQATLTCIALSPTTCAALRWLIQNSCRTVSRHSLTSASRPCEIFGPMKREDMCS